MKRRKRGGREKRKKKRGGKKKEEKKRIREGIREGIGEEWWGREDWIGLGEVGEMGEGGEEMGGKKREC